MQFTELTLVLVHASDSGRQGAHPGLRYRLSDFNTGPQSVAYNQLVKPPDHRLSHPVSSQISLSGLPTLIPNPSLSGITAATLNSVTMTLADVQMRVLTLIKPSTILLGHSFESDLRALKLSQERCIGTTLQFYHMRGRPLKPHCLRASGSATLYRIGARRAQS